MRVNFSQVPEKYDPNLIEAKWRENWEKTGVYRWDKTAKREESFVVDTPPPTVSGSLHIGHVFSYTQTDTVVRYQRMRGKKIFYPMGWDDNGLATERRVQNYFGIRCDPSLAYDPNWKPVQPSVEVKHPQSVSRKNFIEACSILTKEDEAAFERLWRKVCLSVDWSLQYATIDEHCRRISQLSFLDLVKQSQVYNAVSTTMWDVDFRSAISQAEIEDREIPGAFHDIRFAIQGGGEFTISTTRPELIPACIAVVAHPEDERYQSLFGKTALTPLFEAPIPIRASEHADPKKGTGILMVCTFGDIMDVEWWKASNLPLKQVIGLDGCLLDLEHTTPNDPKNSFWSLNSKQADEFYSKLKGKSVKQAQKEIVQLLGAHGPADKPALVGDPKPITHPVKFYEKGDRPLEFIPTRQWFQRLLEHKEALLTKGRQVKWHPAHMLTRYEHWVQGLNQDWCLSRQRFFGVPFPVWYPINSKGEVNYANPIYATADRLPVDPMADTPEGFSADSRDKANGFTGDPDVMDTWATSSLTPQICSHWKVDSERHRHLFPFDMRPQAHEIIRTWAFYTIVRAWIHEDSIPWKHAAISGFIMDPDRKKMSKSKGNVVTPEGLLDEYSADGVRYWASRARLGIDTAFDKNLFSVGKKLVTKIFNASKFVLLQFDRLNLDPNEINLAEVVNPLDLSLLLKLRDLVQAATASFDEFDYAAALQASEEAFWNFCDNYLELVKVRAYSDLDSPDRRSALHCLAWSLKTFLRLFAPVLPYVTEEVWSWAFCGKNNEVSIHTAKWPSVNELAPVNLPSDFKAYDLATQIISLVRGKKTELQKSLKWEVQELSISVSKAEQAIVTAVMDDIMRAGNVVKGGLVWKESESLTVSVKLSDNWAPTKH